jgi:hypothetical protein
MWVYISHYGVISSVLANMSACIWFKDEEFHSNQPMINVGFVLASHAASWRDDESQAQATSGLLFSTLEVNRHVRPLQKIILNKFIYMYFLAKTASAIYSPITPCCFCDFCNSEFKCRNLRIQINKLRSTKRTTVACMGHHYVFLRNCDLRHKIKPLPVELPNSVNTTIRIIALRH